MNESLLAEAKRLPPRERLELIDALWDTLDPVDVPVTSEEQAILEARMADIEAHPGAQEPWLDAKAWLESRPGR